MKNVMKSLFLALAVVVLLAACSNSGNTPSGTSTGGASPTASPGGSATPEADPFDALPRKVSISAFDRGSVSSDEGTYEKNRWVDWIREKSGIDVSMVPVPRGQAQDSLNVLIASKQAPDLIWEYDRSYIGKLVTQEVLQPIGEYIEKYSTSYKKYLEENQDLLPYLTFDGEMYAVATKRPITSIANHGMWIRQDWLAEVGMENPTTIEELIAVARAFKERYPDSAPIVGQNTFDIYSAIYGAFNNMWYVEDNKMQYGATLDRFGEVVQLEKQLYEEELVDREYLTDSNNQRAAQLWSTGRAGILMGQWGLGNIDNLNRDLLTNVPEAQPEPLEMVSSPYGHYGAYQESAPFIFVALSKDAANPKAAIEYLDWVFENWRTLVSGEEGVHYEMVDGVAKKLDADKYSKEVGYAGEYAVLRQEMVKPEYLSIMAADDELSQRIAKLNSESLTTVLKHPFRKDIPYQPNFEEINEIRSSFDQFIRETRAEAVTQKGDKYNGKWALEEIRKEWERLGGPEAEQLAQKWYEDNKASF
jgi:putative aldouronate transport system substrate-binding protein